MSAVSSTLSVVWVMKASRSGSCGARPDNVCHRLDQQNRAVRQLAHRADHFRMADMADHHHLKPVGVVSFGLDMHLRDQRAGRIDIEHLPRLGLGRHRFRHAVGGEDHRPIGGALVEFLDEDRALVAQPVHHEAVVHDFVAHIDRSAPFLEGHLDDLDCPVDAGAEAARCGKVEGQGIGHGPRHRSFRSRPCYNVRGAGMKPQSAAALPLGSR